MTKGKIRVLYICAESGYGGAALSLKNLISSVLKDVEPIVLMREIGPLTNLLKDFCCPQRFV